MENISTAKVNKKAVITDSKVFTFCCWAYLFALVYLPDGFGFHFIILFSAKRILLVVCMCMILFNRERLNKLIAIMKKMTILNIILGMDAFVRFYTAVYRRDVSTFITIIETTLAIYMLCYIMKYEIPVQAILKFLRVALVVLSVLGIFEFITHVNLFALFNTTSNFPMTLFTPLGSTLRVQGNCRHSIHFGIYLTILFVLSCYDDEKNRIYLFRSPIILLLSFAAILFTGSRAAFGIYLISFIIIVIFSKRDELIKSVIFISVFLSLLIIVILLFYNTTFVQELLSLLTGVVDSLFGTELAFKYFPDDAWHYYYSAATREMISKVFLVDYLNPLIGRGTGYSNYISIQGRGVVISVDNNFVCTYIALGYPGMIVSILMYAFCGLLCLKYLYTTRNRLYAIIFIAVLGYCANMWYVASMGTSGFFTMAMCIAVVKSIEDRENKKEKFLEVRKHGIGKGKQ